MRSRTVFVSIGVLRRRKLALAYLVSSLLLRGTVHAQTSTDEPHVSTRIDLQVCVNTNAPSTPVNAPYKARVDLVLVPVSVTDERNRAVTGLEKKNFQIYENKRLQSINNCSSEDSPISVGILLGTSGSMRNKLQAYVSTEEEILGPVLLNDFE